MTEVHFRKDDRGVTPVVGIILMISITVLLAATVGAFVMGMEEDTVESTAPTVAMQFNYEQAETSSESDTLTIIHDTGAGLASAQTYVTVRDATCTGGDDPNGQYQAKNDFGELQRIGAGMTLRLETNLDGGESLCDPGQLRLEKATVHVIWQAGDGTNSHTLSTWHGPEASF